MVSISICISQSDIRALGQQCTGRLQLLNINRICIIRTCRHIMDFLAGCINAAAGKFRAIGNRKACGIQGSLYGSISTSQCHLAAVGPCAVELDGFFIAFPTARAQLSGVQVLEVAGQLYMEGILVRICNNSNVIAGELGSIHRVGGLAIDVGRSDSIAAAGDGNSLVGATGHDVLIVCRSGTEAGIVTAEADLAGHSIELGAVDGVGARRTDKTSRYVLDAAGSVFTAYCNNTISLTARIVVATIIAIGVICVVVGHAGRDTVLVHCRDIGRMDILGFIFLLDGIFGFVCGSVLVFIRSKCFCIALVLGQLDGFRRCRLRRRGGRFCAEIDGIAESSCHIVAEDLEIGYGCRLLCYIDGVVLALKYLYRLDT